MKIITRRIAINENDVIPDKVKVSTFSTLNAVSVNAVGHGLTSNNKVATVNISDHVTDSGLLLDIDYYSENNRRKNLPLYIDKTLKKGSDIRIQARDLGVAPSYPYFIYVTLFCS